MRTTKPTRLSPNLILALAIDLAITQGGFAFPEARAQCGPHFSQNTPLLLKTKRLQIRAIGSEAFAETVKIFSDPRNQQMSGDRVAAGVLFNTLENGILTLSDVRQNSSINFGLFVGQKMVGFAQLAIDQGGSARTYHAGVPGQIWATIGYQLAPEFWGNGLATEASARLIEFAFDQLKVDGVSALVLKSNSASIHVLEKNGLVSMPREPEITNYRRYVLPKAEYLRSRAGST